MTRLSRRCSSAAIGGLGLLGLALWGVSWWGCLPVPDSPSIDDIRPANHLADRATENPTVRVVVSFPAEQTAGHRREWRVSWKERMTVLDATRTAFDMPPSERFERKQHRNEKISLEYSGEGETAYLHRIGELPGTDSDGKYWMYYVNARLGRKSFGAFELAPGDEVSWRLTPLEEVNFDDQDTPAPPAVQSTEP